MSASANQSHALPTLASRQMPRRVHTLLEGILELTSDEFERGIVASLNEFEQHLFKFAEQARSNMVQTHWLEAQRLIKRTRPDLVPRFLVALEAELAGLRDAPEVRVIPKAKPRQNNELSLVNEIEVDEHRALFEISSKAELSNSLPLYLLGQRFGVLAGRPAFDAENLPIGPQALCRMIGSAADCLELSDEHRLIFFRIFDRQVMPAYGKLIESVNTFLAKNSVLPNLQYVPVRARPLLQSVSEKTRVAEPRAGKTEGNASQETDNTYFNSTARPESGSAGPDTGMASRGSGAGSGYDGGASATGAKSATTSWEGSEMSSDEGFQVIRQLLAGRRQVLSPGGGAGNGVSLEPAYVASSGELQNVLGHLQTKPLAPVLVAGIPTTRSIVQLKQDVLSMLQESAPANTTPTLAEEDGDAIDLVGLLFDSIIKDVKPNSPAAVLLSKLQVPLMRVALQDKGFFTRQQHPARQMLNSIVTTGTTWMSDDEVDEGLVKKMNSVVDRTVGEFNGDLSLFSNLLEDLSSHLQTVSRKAEVAERRHVEAARGKEKLALARNRAATVVEGMLKEKNLPRFTHTLLSQAWTDVMALTALRQGENSEPWKNQLGIAERVIQIAQTPTAAQQALIAASPGLEQEIEQALSQVGYQGDEASAIAQRLVHPQAGNEQDIANRTELTMHSKARARLGADLPGDKAKKIPLTAEEQACVDKLKQAAFGTWFEFISNQQGDRTRRRLSWFSTITGHALFVNQRGQKSGEFTLEGLAKMMVRGQLFIVEEQKTSIIDRAWNGVLSALRSYSSPNPSASPSPVQ